VNALFGSDSHVTSSLNFRTYLYWIFALAGRLTVTTRPALICQWRLKYDTYCSTSGSLQQTRGERCLVTNSVAHQQNQRGICALSSIPPVNTMLEDSRSACARTSPLCGCLYVESDRDLWPRVRGTLRGYGQTACTPARWHDTRAGVTSRQNRCITPCEVRRAER
jgi:hypothetical protein